MAGVDDFEDLKCWQLASALCDEVYRLTEIGRVKRDFKFVNQIRDSSASAPRNISEGWGRYYPNQNAPFVRIAKSSLDETRNHHHHGRRRKYFSPEDFKQAFRLCKRAIGATTRYLLYLESCGDDVPGQPPPPKNRRRQPPRPPAKPPDDDPDPEPNREL